MEKKFINVNLSEFKLIEEGDGQAEGVYNKMFIVDDGGDIVIGLEGEGEFLKSGFIADTHGIGNGTGVYTVATQVGVPLTIGVKNGDEIYGSFEFHETDYAQDCRKVMRKRQKHGAVNPYSIGYDLVDAPIYLRPNQFTREQFAKYIPSQYIDRCLAGAKGRPWVRLIKVKLNENSTVPIPMNKESLASEVKSAPFDGVKNWINGDIPSAITLSILDLLWCKYIWCCYDIKWDDNIVDKGAAYLDAFEEFSTYVRKYIPIIMSAGNDDAALLEEIKSTVGDKTVTEFKADFMKDGIDRHFKADLSDTIEVVEWTIKRAERIAAKSAESKSPFNAKNSELLRQLTSKLDGLKSLVTTPKSEESPEPEVVAPEIKTTPDIDIDALKRKSLEIDGILINRNIQSRQ